MNYKIAVLTPTERDDFYCDTVLDGLALLKKENSELQFFYPEYYPHPFGNAFTKQFGLSKEKLADFAKKADIIILFHGKYGTDTALIDELYGWDKTVYVDGSEIGKNKWRDPEIQYQIITGTYGGQGAPNKEMQKKCRLYF